MQVSKRQKLVDVIHATIRKERMGVPDILLALSQVMTDVGLTLWNIRDGVQGLKSRVDTDFLKLVESKHYESPGIDTALLLQAALMITWAEDWLKSEQKKRGKSEGNGLPATEDR